MQMSQFVDTIGIVTHVGSEPYNDSAQITEMLDYLGIHNLRQNAPTNAQSMTRLLELGQAGAKIDLLINGNGPVTLKGALDNIAKLQPYLNAIEGPNEVNLWPISYGKLTGIQAAIAFQEDLYAAVRGNAALDGIPVYSFTLGGVLPVDVPGLIDLSHAADYANIHSYAPNGIQPEWVIPASVDGMATIAADKPVVLTETGYYTLPGHRDWGGVSEAVQAKYSLNMAFENAQAGIARTYFYDLINDSPDPARQDRESNFGFFTYDGQAKQVATAFHNLTSIIAAVGGDASGGTEGGPALAYTLTDMPWTASSMVLDGADGVHLIAVWNGTALWNNAAGVEIQAEHHNVTLWLGEMAQRIRVYDPMLGTSAIFETGGEDTLTLDLVDHPLLIEVLTAPVEQRPEHSLVVRISEDEWQGHAQFIVTVNGKQQGGVYTTTAARSEGESQDFTIKGHWDDGPVKVGVTFLNDAWGGTADTDRNLYVEGIALDGVDYAGTFAYLPTPAPVTFDVGNAADALPAEEGTLTLRMSEDAWKHHAKIAVWVDGKKQGGNINLSASEAQGKTQLITIHGDWDDGQHVVMVKLLNDAWGGTPATDRNAYVHGLSFNGVAYAEAEASLLDPTPYKFVTDATGVA